MPHQPRQVRRVRVQHQVVMVPDEAVRQHLGIEALHRVSDDVQVRKTVIVVAVDRLTTIAS